MKRTGIFLAGLGLVGLVIAGFQSYAQEKSDETAEKKGEFKTVKEKVSYGFGMDIGQNIARSMQSRQIDVDQKALLKGIQDALAGSDSRVPEEEMQAALQSFQEEMVAKAKLRRQEEAKKRIESDPELKAQAEKNAKEGAAFLKANKAKEGVKTTESGLQYKVIKKGDGKKPESTDVVTTHYHGTLPDGTVFDSSVERERPATFAVNGVIDGWTEALQLMPVGSKWKLFVPAKLAYGLSGSGPDIGPNQVLVFEVELLEIQSDSEEGKAPQKSPSN